MQCSSEAAGGAPRHDPVRETVHDLRNLFAVIASIRHLLDKNDDDGPARETMLRGLEEAAVRGDELTSRLLARRTSGERLLVDMGAQVADAAPLLRAVVKHPASLEIDTQMALPAARVCAEPAEMEAVMLELVANAARAGARHIRLRCRRIGDWIWLVIADDGPGLLAAAVDRPPLKASDSGHGNGLHRVRRAVRDMNGKLFIRGSVSAGAGTVVAMLLPVAFPAASKSRPRQWGASPTNEESCDEDRWTVAA
ncbi:MULTISPECIES: ATP-binding protein [Sphingobium]|uniref:ATP-binding protein n=1 Tax=Sphingobium sp. MI1205 TaxID=407020 RepID=UPI00077013BD|nr:HAMP domain-containing sensor histidine kinase [Sphingobium sp. MI1205]AMK17387.1 multi-sensor hybrid histidine kinase [Sphingobium sp. MI1205]